MLAAAPIRSYVRFSLMRTRPPSTKSLYLFYLSGLAGSGGKEEVLDRGMVMGTAERCSPRTLSLLESGKLPAALASIFS